MDSNNLGYSLTPRPEPMDRRVLTSLEEILADRAMDRDVRESGLRDVTPSLRPSVTPPNVRVLTSLGNQLVDASNRPIVMPSMNDEHFPPPQVIFVRGNIADYHALEEKNEDTLYFVAEPGAEYGQLFMGDLPIATNVVIDTTLSDLADVAISQGIVPSSFLTWNGTNWVDTSPSTVVSDLLPSFIGADNVNPGRAGLVPAPNRAAPDEFLKSNGTWAKLTAEDLPYNMIPISNAEIDEICT